VEKILRPELILPQTGWAQETAIEKIKNICLRVAESKFQTFEPLLPLTLCLDGKAFNLRDHFAFSPLFRARTAYKTLLKSGRQCGKSRSLAARGVLLALLIPFFKQLYVTPLFEQIRRFSSNYVAPFLHESPVRNLFLNDAIANSVLQRTFGNGSSMIFSFAWLNADRARGIPANSINYDEIQDMDISFLPIINESLSADTRYGLLQYAGTPKSLNNTLQRLWTDTSMAEWVIKCNTGGCNHYNIPALEFDLLQMTGPVRADISEKQPGVICAKCQKPLQPRPVSQGGNGRWVHRINDRRWDFAGFHVPQHIMPMHYAHPRKWAELVSKSQGRGNTPLNVYFNEVCGEAFDTGSRLITLTDILRAAVLPWKNNPREALDSMNRYTLLVCGVDWGGGGVKRGRSDFTMQSYTTVAVCGLTSNGRIEVIYGYRSNTPYDHVREAKLIMKISSTFGCHLIAHDFTGAGTTRETILAQAGVPLNRIVPVAYTGGLKGNLIKFEPASETLPRDHYMLDRNRSLSFLCQFIRSGVVRFFQDDYRGAHDPGVLRDFLTLIEDKKDSAAGRGQYKILRDPSGPDDFAHSVNIASMVAYQLQGKWPDLSAYEDIGISDEYAWALQNPTYDDWMA
jgi:hypothetical protein